MSLEQTPFIIIGGGGHAGVVLSVLTALGRTVLGFTDLTPNCLLQKCGIKNLGSEDAIGNYSNKSVLLANGLGFVGKSRARMERFDELTELGYTFPALVHPSAVVDPSSRLLAGSQVMAGAIIQPHAIIGANSIVNSSVTVDHECEIGSHAHIAPGSVLCGGVKIGNGTLIGAGSTIIPKTSVGDWSVVGAGSLVIRDIPSDTKAFGTPTSSYFNSNR